MTTNCQQIDLVLSLAQSQGNSISEVVEGWTKVKKVIYMKLPLQAALKDQVEKQTNELRYRKFEGSSHYPADEGFICDDHSIAVSFPVKK